MTADEFNRRVNEDIAWMVRRNQERYDESVFLDSYIANRGKPEFKDAPESFEQYLNDPEWGEEAYLDSRERSKDQNSCR